MRQNSLIINYFPFIYLLSITHYPLPITHYPLPITRYPLPIAKFLDSVGFANHPITTEITS
ncbi:MAG: hypothetical protein HC836_08580 [Richelia sp. RM2_1_2]|nr:hypothetical protein [Richelia sp. RM1_1_1]NJO28307.1 hypothetical protein [Richelia sp. SL_2_1]NJO58398.1 hypothetical protein [Richelia sp. RM2_1_2]